MRDISEYKVGVVLETESVGGAAKSKSSKALTSCRVDIGGDEPLTIVTSATNVREGSRIVVAPVGSTFTDEEGEDRPVKKATVGGVVSEGMLCDSKMLGWSGGARGVAATLPDDFGVGSAPPPQKPRPKEAEGDAAIPGAGAGPGLFEKKLTKEEKKKLAEERRKARKAKKEAAKAAKDS